MNGTLKLVIIVGKGGRVIEVGLVGSGNMQESG